MDRMFFGAPTPAMASGEAESPPPELIENMKDKHRIMELEALLRRPHAGFDDPGASFGALFGGGLW
eukprot:5859146-Heterocapsa_arctica.AAC.1